VALAGQVAWGALGPRSLRGVGGAADGRSLRLAWGTAAFPQVFALFLLLPLDLAVVGPATFTSERLTDPVSAAWASVSVAIALVLAAWSAFLFVRGSQVAAGVSLGRATLASMAAVACLAMIVGALVAGASFVVGRWA
jgi:hypothetical protein